MAKKLVELYLSGGASNTDINSSLGGVVSTSEMGTNTVTYTSVTIPGITLVDSAGLKNNGAIGELTVRDSGARVYYVKPNGEQPSTINEFDITGADGEYVIPCEEGDASIIIDVVNASIGADQFDIAIEQILVSPNLFANVLEAEAQAGSKKYRHLYIKNTDAASISVGMYVKSNYNGLDVLAIGFFSLVSGGTDVELVDENTAPVSVNFKTPINIDDAEVLTLNSGEYLGVYFRREVSALSDVSISPSSAVIFIELL